MRRCLSVMMWIKSDVMLHVVRGESARTREIYHLEHSKKDAKKTHVNTHKHCDDDDRKGVVVITRGTVEYCWLLHVYDCVFSLPRRGRGGGGGSVGG